MTRIKICGITRLEDIELCSELHVEMIGLNFHRQSPRFIEPRQARELLEAVPPWMNVVAVFGQEPLRQVCALVYQLGIRTIQWYGSFKEWENPFPHQLLPGFRIQQASDLQAVESYCASCAQAGGRVGGIVVDGYHPDMLGGSGHRAPWNALEGWSSPAPLFLAGGLKPENVTEAIAQVKPAAVDVASGVEFSPGVKDSGKMKAFVQAVRSTEQRIQA